ncbi:MAG TPA: DUF2442 domain-containing protein [Acetobacteraceae bacterium]|nr:DUF2442 domain-containing protein [Acetobacteraceae bacterium]
MPQVLDNVILSVSPDTGNFTVTLTWANGETSVNDFRSLVGRGALGPLADPAVFAEVRVGERGRSLEWPGNIDFCADALWFETHPAEAPRQELQPDRQPTYYTSV